MEQNEFLRYTLDQLDQLEIEYAIVGSFASGVYGEPRFTQDVDVVADVRQWHVRKLCQSFPAPDFYVSQIAIEEAVTNRRQFNVIHIPSGNKIDFMLSVQADPWKASQLSRRREMQFFPDRTAHFASPEDVILGKLSYYREAGSEKHLRDITGILSVRMASLDIKFLEEFAGHLDVLEIWEAVVQRYRNSKPE